MKKELVCFFVGTLMVLTTVGPISAATSWTKQSQPLHKGSILYVGGSGPNNYSKIQDAIFDAADGDIVFVYDDSAPYYERLQVCRSITLMGEDKLTTIIDGGSYTTAPVLNITADGVIVQGFTIQNSTVSGWLDDDAGIIMIADHVTIKDNIITDHNNGIQVGGWKWNQSYEANFCTIQDNEITHNKDFGIYLKNGNETYVSHNRISSNNFGGISTTSYSNSNMITLNQIIDNDGFGISLNYGVNTTVLRNNITGNRGGVYILDSNKNSITENNIYRNGLLNAWMDSDVIVAVLTRTSPLQNTWDANYWGRSRQLPKPIVIYSFLLLLSMFLSMTLQFHRIIDEGSFFLIPLGFFMVKFDWHPANEPYDIPGMN